MLVTTKSSYCFKNFYEGGKSQSCLEFCAQFCHPNLHVTMVCEKRLKIVWVALMIFLKSSQYSKLISKLFFPSSQRSNSLLITQFFETIEKQRCKQKNNTVFFGGSTYLHFNIDDESQEVNFHVLSLNWKKNLPCGGLSRNRSRWFSVGFRRFSLVKKWSFLVLIENSENCWKPPWSVKIHWFKRLRTATIHKFWPFWLNQFEKSENKWKQMKLSEKRKVKFSR